MRLDFLLPLVLLAAVACGGDDDDDSNGGGNDASTDAGGTIPDGGGGDAGQADAAPGTDGGGTGNKCGGSTDLKCDDQHFCDWEDDSCGINGDTGRCMPRPADCGPVKPQVCGCDGNAYENLCEAQKAGTDQTQIGICQPTASP
ncbi:MAG TPA: hypothetical protein VKB80_07290 [Kofleriaceae bacterium]|nr:hypothetical protein [Kofleriaceae bacterium]